MNTWFDSWLTRMERRVGRYAVSNVTLGFIGLQVVTYILSFGRREILDAFYLIPNLVLDGQYWRLISFLAVPPVSNPIFAFFFWYMFYLMGGALDEYWGSFRYNVFLLIGYLATVAAAFITPAAGATNAFLQGSVFLAFAFLYPDFVIYIMFILPVKIKYIALLTWIVYIYTLITGAWSDRVMVIAGILNFVLFFAEDIVYSVRTGKRHMSSQARTFGMQSNPQEPFHRCAVCGITDLSHPDMDFRYCPECANNAGYCTEHIKSHTHITDPV